jgi:hypothetical protein
MLSRPSLVLWIPPNPRGRESMVSPGWINDSIPAPMLSRPASFEGPHPTGVGRESMAHPGPAAPQAAANHHFFSGHFRCRCRNANVPFPLIVCGPTNHSISVRSPSPSRAA